MSSQTSIERLPRSKRKKRETKTSKINQRGKNSKMRLLLMLVLLLRVISNLQIGINMKLALLSNRLKKATVFQQNGIHPEEHLEWRVLHLEEIDGTLLQVLLPKLLEVEHRVIQVLHQDLAKLKVVSEKHLHLVDGLNLHPCV